MGENASVKSDLEDMKSLLNDVQKRRDDLKSMNDELTSQVSTAISSRQALETDLQSFIKLSDDTKSFLERKHIKETSELSDRISRLELRLTEKDDELHAMQRKVSEAKSYKGQIFDDVQMLEENLTQMQDTISTLRKQLAEKTKEIEALEYELNCSRQESKNFQELVDARRKNGEVISGLREKERKMDGELSTMVEGMRKIKQENHELVVRLNSIEKEKTGLTENCELLRSQLVGLTSELKLAQDKSKRIREDTQQEMMGRIIALKQEKLDLEAKFEELQDQIDIQKRSFYEIPSLMDELKQLDDMGGFRPSRMAQSPLTPGFEKQVESLRIELVAVI